MLTADIFDDFSSFHEVVLLACTVAELNAFKAAAAKAAKTAEDAKAAEAAKTIKSKAIHIKSRSSGSIQATLSSACIPSAPPLSAIALYRIRARKLPR